MQGVSGSWLFDTGASVSLISIKEFRKISPEHRPQKKPATINLTCASDKMLSIVGIYDFNLTIQGRTIRHPVYVANNLGNAAILGIDAIKAFGLIYSPSKNSFNFENKINQVNSVNKVNPLLLSDFDTSSQLASLSVIKSVTIPALTSLPLSVSTVSSLPFRPPANMIGLAHVGTAALPYLNGGPGLVQTDRLGEVKIRVNNCAPTDLFLPKGSIIGYLETIDPASVKEIDQQLLLTQLIKLSPVCPLLSLVQIKTIS